jgi:hypothetical protein
MNRVMICFVFLTLIARALGAEMLIVGEILLIAYLSILVIGYRRYHRREDMIGGEYPAIVMTIQMVFMAASIGCAYLNSFALPEDAFISAETYAWVIWAGFHITMEWIMLSAMSKGPVYAMTMRPQPQPKARTQGPPRHPLTWYINRFISWYFRAEWLIFSRRWRKKHMRGWRMKLYHWRNKDK